MTIYPNTIGSGFRIYHAGDFVHVGPNVRIGRNCTMLPGVVFGNKSETPDNTPVVVGDNCYFGLGAKILGGVKIGNNVIVGANAVVTKDIPDNAVVGGIPAKIIKKRDISIDILKFFAVLLITNSHMELLYGKYSLLATGEIV